MGAQIYVLCEPLEGKWEFDLGLLVLSQKNCALVVVVVEREQLLY